MGRCGGSGVCAAGGGGGGGGGGRVPSRSPSLSNRRLVRSFLTSLPIHGRETRAQLTPVRVLIILFS